MAEEKRDIKNLKNVKKVTVGGEEYTLQKLPIRPALELRQSWIMDNGLANQLTMSELVLEHIVVSPKVKIEDFEDIPTLEAVVEKALNYQYTEKGK